MTCSSPILRLRRKYVELPNTVVLANLMGRLNIDDTSVSSQLLFQVFRSCQELGARKPVLLSALDLTDAQLRDPRARFSARAITTLSETAAQELGRDDIFADIGRAMTPTGFSDVCYTAMFEETVGDVLQAAAAAMLAGTDKPLLRWEQSESVCRLIADSNSCVTNELIFIIFSALSYIGQIVTDGSVQLVKSASFTYRTSFDRNASMTLVKDDDRPVPCLFNQPDTYLELHKQVLDLPNPFANRNLVNMGQQQLNRFQVNGAKSVTLASLSYNYLFYLLDKSGLSLDAAAETFGIAERTLRRKLAAEGASFRQILEQVRRDTCQLYFLEGTRSLSDIATKLGYSELSAFTRAYTAWHGRSPSRDMAAQIAVNSSQKPKFSGKMVGVERVELPTPSMSTKCSTTELYAHAAGRLASHLAGCKT